jgi:hypothetical protein
MAREKISDYPSMMMMNNGVKTGSFVSKRISSASGLNKSALCGSLGPVTGCGGDVGIP